MGEQGVGPLGGGLIGSGVQKEVTGLEMGRAAIIRIFTGESQLTWMWAMYSRMSL